MLRLVVRPVLARGWRTLHHRYQTIRLFGRDARLVPPLEMMHDGPGGYGEFKANGREFFRHYVELCGLRPDERMLDIGCGIGRKTLPLISYLSARGAYEGIDTVQAGIDWCVERYTAAYPNFRFQTIDVFNRYYNPNGRHRASEYRLPFPDEHFDFAAVNSVFTHMLPDDVANYLCEVARVLKTDGRCLASFFLLNDESRGLIDTGQSTLDLRHDVGPARAVSREVPERAVGYDEEHVVRLYEASGLRIKEPIWYGSWCSRREFLSYQDQILAFKAAPIPSSRDRCRQR